MIKARLILMAGEQIDDMGEEEFAALPRTGDLLKLRNQDHESQRLLYKVKRVVFDMKNTIVPPELYLDMVLGKVHTPLDYLKRSKRLFNYVPFLLFLVVCAGLAVWLGSWFE